MFLCIHMKESYREFNSRACIGCEMSLVCGASRLVDDLLQAQIEDHKTVAASRFLDAIENVDLIAHGAGSHMEGETRKINNKMLSGIEEARNDFSLLMSEGVGMLSDHVDTFSFPFNQNDTDVVHQKAAEILNDHPYAVNAFSIDPGRLILASISVVDYASSGHCGAMEIEHLAELDS